ncbi:MAG: hypothetical protein ABEJ99_04920 [Candidatus Nanohaloarchaea archaeon]
MDDYKYGLDDIESLSGSFIVSNDPYDAISTLKDEGFFHENPVIYSGPSSLRPNSYHEGAFYDVESGLTDLTGQGVEITEQLEALHRNGYRGNAVVIMDADTLGTANDKKRAFRYLHTMSSKISLTENLQLVLDSGADEQWSSIVASLMDGRIEL